MSVDLQKIIPVYLARQQEHCIRLTDAVSDSSAPFKPVSINKAAAIRVVLFFVLMLCGWHTASAQNRVTGIVQDSTGQTLVGVSVKLKNTSTGTLTDLNGKYTITTAVTSKTLVFTYIGFETREVVVEGNAPINVVLRGGSNQLAQVNVVSVGYGRQKRAYVTGAVSSANLDVLKDAPNTNIAQSLQGNIPGLNVGVSSVAGGTPPIQVRGRTTLSGNQNVLIILDGIQYNNSLTSINPDDIASIDLLKDASSTAVYGAQAANGVLLITTRKGAANAKPRINLTTSYTTQTPSGNIKALNREQFLDKVRDLNWDQAYLAPDYKTPNPNFNLANYVDVTQRNGTQLLPNDFNWYDAATNNGFIFDNQLSISGASEKVNYLISGAYTKQAGFIINDKFKRQSLRVNLESQATSWLKVGVQAFGSFVNQDGAEPTVSAVFQMSPLQTPYNADGTLNPFPFNSVDPNPFLTYDVNDYERHNYVTGNIYGEIAFPFVKGLTYRLNWGNNGRQDRRNFASRYAGGQTGQAYKENENYYDYTIDNILTYTKTIQKHNILATAVYGAVKRIDDFTRATGTGFTNLTLGYNNLSLGTTPTISSGGYEESLNYYMGRINYTYNGKYLVTATVRRDGYSAFAANNKWGTFPSVSLGWNISEEGFVKNLNLFDNLKLRGGYGVAGNQTVRYYSLDQLTTQPAYVFGDGGTTIYGSNISTLSNPDLKWEKTTEVNVGLDFGLLKSRITGSLDLYSRRTRDLLFSVSIPTITGYSSINSNVGELANKGIEVSINTVNLTGDRLKWNTTFNFSRNINQIKALTGRGDLVGSNLFINQSISAIYGYKTNGIYQLGETVPAGNSVGTYRVVDNNGDGKVDANDRSILGSGDPAFRFSILNKFQYRDFTLTFLLNSIQGGNNGYLAGNSPSIGRSDVNIRNGGIANIQYWTPANPDSPYALYLGAGPTINPTLYYSRSFVRLQDVTLAYQFRPNLLKKLKIQNISLFASGKNLVTWTKWKGWDPEITDANGNFIGGLTTSGRPLLIGYSFGTNLTF